MGLRTSYEQGRIDGEHSKSDSAIDKLVTGGSYQPKGNSDEREMYDRGFREGRK